MTVDLRTDTITRPTDGMRAAMAAAEVGDDFYHEDPTVKALEARAAELMGKEAALYVPSGTMGNLLAHLVHVPGGGEVVGPEPSHTFTNEGGGPWRVAGLTVRTVAQPGPRLDVERYAALTRGSSVLAQATRLYWVEEPTRGWVVPLADLAALRALADEHRIPIHMDGARIFNAAIALGVAPAVIAGSADSVMFCVSKGLGAPVGSVLTGTEAFIDAARRDRQMLGGGLRQAGIICAGGLYALDNHVARLADDHTNARRLADGLRAIPGLQVDRAVVETNIFYVEVEHEQLDVAGFAAGLAERGVFVNPPSKGRRSVRFVTHLGVDAADIERAIDAASDVMGVPAPSLAHP